MSGPDLEPAVEAALVAAGWSPNTRDDARAARWALAVAARAGADGLRHTVVPPAVEVFAVYGGLTVPPGGNGEQVASSGFRIDPSGVTATTATLTAFGAALHTTLTPIGAEGDDTGILAIDEAGRVFVIDHVGEWFLGDSVEAAFATLVLGRLPARVAPDGTW
jgi:hypothetical protein